MKIALISCASKKIDRKAKAKELYASHLFKLNLEYARKNSDKAFILSAKHGLLELDEEIEPYDLTLNNMKDSEIEQWAEKVLSQLKIKTSVENDEFIILAGKNYFKHLLPQLKNYSISMEHIGLFDRIKFLKENTK